MANNGSNGSNGINGVNENSTLRTKIEIRSIYDPFKLACAFSTILELKSDVNSHNRRSWFIHPKGLVIAMSAEKVAFK
jgi:hypothetical protein